MHLSQIHRYPVKSAGGQQLNEALTDRFGLVGDRRWMLVDPSGRFVSQRERPALARLSADETPAGLALRWADERVDVAVPDPRGECVLARVWQDTVVAPVAPNEVNQWLSACLNNPVRLVHFPATALRGVEPGYAPASQLIAFSDGYPLLVTTEASIDELNKRLPEPVAMDRFRPNLVIAGADPHAEDNWNRLKIGDYEIALVKPCSRCAIPAVNQQTGFTQPQVLKALAQYRLREGVIYFGMNATAPADILLRQGDAVSVIN